MRSFLFRFAILLATTFSAGADTLFYASVTNQYSGTPPGNILKVASNGTASVWNINWDTPIELFDPKGLAFDTHGNLFVNDGSSVFKIDSVGNGTTFATKPNDYGANGLAVDAQNNVYVGGAVGSNFAIYRYDSLGHQTAVWDAGAGVNYDNIKVGPDGALYTANVFSDEVYRIDSVTGVRTVYATVPTASDLSFDSLGNLYVIGGPGLDLIYKVPAGGGAGVLYVDEGVFGQADGIAVAANGDLFVGNEVCNCESDNEIKRVPASGPATTFSTLSEFQKVNSIAMTPVPEPGVWGVTLGAFLILFALFRRRRSRN